MEQKPASNRAGAHPNDPLHGKTLQSILEFLVERYGWENLGSRIKIKCFQVNPSIKSSLTFLRRTPWARERVEVLYVGTLRDNDLEKKRNTRKE